MNRVNAFDGAVMETKVVYHCSSLNDIHRKEQSGRNFVDEYLRRQIYNELSLRETFEESIFDIVKERLLAYLSCVPFSVYDISRMTYRV